MERFRGFEDAALQGRVERLKRGSQDLEERVQARISQVEIERGWLRSDPLYQRLSGILERVREDLRESEQELSRREAASAARKAAPSPARLHTLLDSSVTTNAGLSGGLTWR